MEEDKRRPKPRRLLSFDPQMSFARIGKALYPSKDRRPAPSTFGTSINQSCQYSTRSSVALLAGNADLAAAVSKECIELIKVDGPLASSVSLLKQKRLAPTAAAWQSEGSQQLGVAEQNGTFGLYELRSADLKMVSSSISIGRSIKSLGFNSVQPELLATAASDGAIRVYDVRQGLHRSVHMFPRNGDVAREVQFQPGSESRLAVIYDSGVVQRWDLRHRQPDLRLNAHQQGLSLDWHPHLNYLVTGGRDHQALVWNLNTALPPQTDVLRSGSLPEYAVQVPHSVSIVRWCTSSVDPVGKAYIATCGRPIESNCLKSAYSLWNLEQPYVPVHTVERHRDAVTDLLVASLNLVWSVGLDSQFVQTDLRFEPLVRQNFAPAIVAMPPWDMGGVSFPRLQTADILGPNSSHHLPRRTCKQLAPQSTHATTSHQQIHSQNYQNQHQNLLPTPIPTSTEVSRSLHRVNSYNLQRSLSALNLHTQLIPQKPPQSTSLASSASSVGSLMGTSAVGTPTPTSLVNGSVQISGLVGVPLSQPVGPASGNTPGFTPGFAPGFLAPLTGYTPSSGYFDSYHHGSNHQNSPLNSWANQNPSPVRSPGVHSSGVPPLVSSPGMPGIPSLNVAAPPSAQTIQGAAVSAANHAAASSNNPAAAANSTLNASADLKYVLEIGLPFEDGDCLRVTAMRLAFTRQFGQTYGDICRQNAKVMIESERAKHAEVWVLLAVAFETLQHDFMKTLTSDEEIRLAERWFAGRFSDTNYESRTLAIEEQTLRDIEQEEMVLFEDESDSEMESINASDWQASSPHAVWTGPNSHDATHSSEIGGDNNDSDMVGFDAGSNPASLVPASSIPSGSDSMPQASSLNSRYHRNKHGFSVSSSLTSRKHRGTSTTQQHRPKIHMPFEVLKEKFFTFAADQTRPWDFVPCLVSSIQRILHTGYYTSSMALLMVFRMFPILTKTFDIRGIIEGGLLTLEMYGSFVSLAVVRNILKQEADANEIYGKLSSEEEDVIIDTVCHRCKRSLSGNAAFYARNDAVVGYWYCSRCRLPLDGCALCDEPITGLCRVLAACGHRLHMDCWDQWVSVECMPECPSGCGQPIYAYYACDAFTAKVLEMRC